MQNRKKKDTDLQNSLLDSVGEGEGGMFQENSIETCTVSRMKQITSPGWMHETSAQTWFTLKTQGERVEREVGGGIRMGNTCKPMDVSFQCMTKFTTNKKKINRELTLYQDAFLQFQMSSALMHYFFLISKMWFFGQRLPDYAMSEWLWGLSKDKSLMLTCKALEQA